MSRLSRRLDAIPGSATLAVATRARQLVAEGRHVISFAAGEPDFASPEHVVAAAARACHDPENHHYSANAGLEPLRHAVAQNTALYSGVPVDASEVLITNGAKQAVFQAFAAVLDPGDEVLLPAPHWVTYPAGVNLTGGVPVSVATSIDNGFKATVSDLEAARTPNTKMLVFVSPSNPTGAVYTAEEARAIGEWASEHDIWVMADEIYQRLYYEGEVAPSIAATNPGYEKWILINGVAKSYAMTGWRVGWIVGPSDIIDVAARHQSHATGNVNNVAQVAATAALTGSQDTVIEMRHAFDRRRRLMFELVSDLPGFTCIEPQGAFYVFPDVSDVLGDRYPSSAALADVLLEEGGVALVPGESFGAPGYIRLSYALGEDDIRTGVERIRQMLTG